MIVVLTFPTVRTVMMEKPVLSDAVRDAGIMERAKLSQPVAFRQHDENVEDYKRHHTDMARTDMPTYLVSRVALCAFHRSVFKLTDWFPLSQLKLLQEASRAKGFDIPDPLLIPVEFKPLGWEPPKKFMERER